jgi:hypothetical protein
VSFRVSHLLLVRERERRTGPTGEPLQPCAMERRLSHRDASEIVMAMIQREGPLLSVLWVVPWRLPLALRICLLCLSVFPLLLLLPSSLGSCFLPHPRADLQVIEGQTGKSAISVAFQASMASSTTLSVNTAPFTLPSSPVLPLVSLTAARVPLSVRGVH